jgi:hypothetical protein
MSRENLTRAVLTQDGRVLVEQPAGSCRRAGSRTDWDRVRAMRDEESEAAAASDPDAPPLDQAFRREARVVFPRPVRKKHNRPAHRRGRAGVVPRPRPRLPDAHECRAARLRRGPKARRQVERRSSRALRAPRLVAYWYTGYGCAINLACRGCPIAAGSGRSI